MDVRKVIQGRYDSECSEGFMPIPVTILRLFAMKKVCRIGKANPAVKIVRRASPTNFHPSIV
jgi:hypothetical protein